MKEPDPSLSLGAAPDDQRTLIERRAPDAPITPSGPGAGATGDAASAPAAAPAHLPQSRLANYELLAEVGRGGMGVVFKARDVKLHRIVALKMIIGGTLARRDDLARFETEAAAAAQLQHAGIVGLFEVGTFENQPYFSMEFVSGSSLAQLASAGPVAGRRAAAYLEAVARAVHFAHRHGILHRDLKPANILLDANDQPKITDFGLAKLMSTDSGQTRTGAVLGTPSYMSPEQAQGRRDIGPAGDIYSLGAILYELLTGRPPFRGESALATLTLVSEQEPVAPRLLNPNVDRDLETITLKCLEKAPGRRYASAEELADDLHRYLQGEPIAARRLSQLGRVVKWCRRKPTLAALLFVSITAVLAFIVFEWQVAVEEADLRIQAQNAEHLAKVREEVTRHLLYLAEVRRAQQTLENADLEQADRLLKKWQPGARLSDLRDWEWYFLRARMQGPFTLAAHGSRANAVAYSPDGKRLATAGGEPTKPGEIKIWDTATGKLLGTLIGHADAITSLDYHPQGHLLASGSYDKTVKVWDLAKNRELITLRGHAGHVSGIAFSSKEPVLASGGGDRTVRLWNYEAALKEDKNFVRVLAGHSKEVSGVAFAPGGDLVASSGLDGTVRLWDAKAGKERAVLKGHDGEVLCVAFSPSGKILASGGGKGSKRGEVKFWEIGSDKAHLSRYGLSDRILALAFSKDGKLAAAGKDGLIRVWDLAASSEAWQFRGDPQLVSAVAFSPDGRHLSWAGRSGRVSIANSSGGLETINVAHFPMEAIAFHPRGRYLACGGGAAKETRSIRIVDLEHPENPPQTLQGPDGAVLAIAYSPSGRHLAAAGDDMLIRIYDMADVKKAPLVLAGHGGRIRALAYRPDGGLLASASDDETIRLWNPADGTPQRVLTGHNNNVLCVAFSADGTRLASGGINKSLRVWNLRDFSSVELTGHTGPVNAVAFSPDDTQLASAGGDKTVRIWDLTKEQHFVKLEGSPSPVIALAYHKGGRRLATACQDRIVRLWDIVTRQEILEMEEAAGSIRAVAFSGDGRYLAAAGQSGLRVWDAGVVDAK